MKLIEPSMSSTSWFISDIFVKNLFAIPCLSDWIFRKQQQATREQQQLKSSPIKVEYLSCSWLL
jgi:hypothetical protein